MSLLIFQVESCGLGLTIDNEVQLKLNLVKIRLEEVSVKRYFKHEAESDLGSGIAYIEFDGELPTRQVEKYGDRWFCSIKPYHPEIGPGLSDRSLSESGLEPQHEISQAEFEEVWNEALKHMQ